MLYRPPRHYDDAGNPSPGRTGTPGNPDPESHRLRAQGIVDTIKAKSKVFRDMKEAFVTPPETVDQDKDWT